MKTQTQAKKVNTTISHKPRILNRNRLQHHVPASVDSQLEVAEEANLHNSGFSLSNLPLNSPPRTQATGGKSMVEVVQAKMEAAFNTDFSDVRIHEGQEAESIGAIAFTQGNHIHFKPGHYCPESQTGQKLLGHELTHVVQQRAGKVSIPYDRKTPINSDPIFEKEADVFGEKAAAGKAVNMASAGVATHSSAQPTLQPIQCKPTPEQLKERYGQYLSESEIEDYIKIQQLLLDNDAMARYLAPLNADLNQAQQSNFNRRPKHALTSLLAQKEKEHGFSDAKVLPLGILPSKQFLELNSLGYMPKDPGAGLAHGEYSHRLQWHAIMQKFEEDSRDDDALIKQRRWKHTPLELYTRLGDPKLNPKDKSIGSLQAYLMDQAGAAPDTGMRNPDQVMINLGVKGQGQPASLLNSTTMDVALPHLAAEVQARAAKRNARSTNKTDSYLKLSKTNPQELQGFLKKHKLSTNPLKIPEEWAMLDYANKKRRQTNKYKEMSSNLLIGINDTVMSKRGIKKRIKEVRANFGLPSKP